MKLLVGLGNPEKKYDGTYHNMGFFVVDKFAKQFGVEISKKKHNALIGTMEINGEKILVVKPLTYMNLSGVCVAEIKKKYCIKNQDVLVVVDDVDLPEGAFRFKNGGSGGTHNGMRNIVSLIGADFPRFRVGIGHPEGVPLVDFVLKKIPQEKQQIFDEVADVLVDLIYEKLGGE